MRAMEQSRITPERRHPPAPLGVASHRDPTIATGVEPEVAVLMDLLGKP